MRTLFISFKECPKLSDAWFHAPWAAEIVRVGGGWMAFESICDAEQWMRQR